MITTITMNPSIDISYPIPNFTLDTVNRVQNTTKTAGGKGLNVTRILKQLKADVTASGLLGGHLGDQIIDQLDNEAIHHSFSAISGETRNCIAILHDGKQTEILEEGPTISMDEATYFMTHFSDLVLKSSLITISGSLPKGLPDDFYIEMVSLCNDNNKPILLDCSKTSLLKVLESDAKPTLIKPNVEELQGILSTTLNTDKEIKEAISIPLFNGIEWVYISQGADGALVKHNDSYFKVIIPSIDVVNPVGSGDATVAGLAYAIDNNKMENEVMITANTMGMLNAQEQITGHVNLDNYNNLARKIVINKL